MLDDPAVALTILVLSFFVGFSAPLAARDVASRWA